MSDTIDKIIAEYTALQLKVKGAEELLRRTENYCAQKLKAQEARYEKLRPHWAKGYSSDSVAAQSKLNAMLELWDLLEAANQTQAVAKLKELIKKKESS